MTFPPNALILRLLAPLVCTVVAACDGAGPATSRHGGLSDAAPASGNLPVQGKAAPLGASVHDATVAHASAAKASTGTNASASASAAPFGSYLRPYAATSLWNARPVNPTFGTFVIQKICPFIRRQKICLPSRI